MPEIDEEVTFYTKADQVEFKTQTNSDELRIRRLELTQEQATSLAWLVNADSEETELEFSVKVKV